MDEGAGTEGPVAGRTAQSFREGARESTAAEPTLARRQAFAPEPAYRRMLGKAAWQRLAPEIRERFSIGPSGRHEIRYEGRMAAVEMSLMGWLFAQCCRLIGTPLATRTGIDVGMRVTLSQNVQLKGITWARCYRFADGFEQTVRSTKRCTADGRMYEYIGRGFSMELEPSEQAGALYFTSVAYHLSLFGRRVRIPALLTPGRTTVIHEQIEGPRFRFCLIVEHPWFGRTFYQDGEFYSDDSAR